MTEMTAKEQGDTEEKPKKRPYTTPTMRYLGSVKDLVFAGGSPALPPPVSPFPVPR